ncbi:pirin family protein [Parahaliea aestuarii]|uniref:Pirin family protein n=1 Tax=Parahaliea aestuarii TaxID=1852021 RepID=A0A5C8ZNG7_9GAMM|nr:pirin family protein [Parahaliea aestuarii]TXS89097.1 pirin family protein [Parahaliea aestuarii]
MQARQVIEVRPARASRDGDGVAIQRITGMGHAGMDPILMVDELRSNYREDFAGGFPPHPHRGMQTLTYMKAGGLIHEDSQGNRGEIRGGGAQWMSAGRGIIHSEMPTQDSRGLHGFQLWVNLPAAEKMASPRYRDVPVGELAVLAGEHFTATAVSGDWQLDDGAVRGPLAELAERAGILDLQLRPGAGLTVTAAAEESLLAYLYSGSLEVRGQSVGPQQLLVTGSGDRWHLQAGAEGAELLLLSGRPIGEPVAHYGPFVMNTQAEIEQAIRDYQAGEFASA